MLVTKTSTLTGIENTLEVPITQNQLDKIKLRNEPIQKIAPDLDRGLREFLISGITPEEWEKEFGC